MFLGASPYTTIPLVSNWDLIFDPDVQISLALQDGLVFTTSVTGQPTYRLIDILSLAASPSAGLELSKVFNETLALSDVLATRATLRVAAGLMLTDAAIASVEKLLLLAETLAITTRASSSLEIAYRLAEALVANDYATISRLMRAQDGAQFSADASQTVEALFKSQETLALADRIRQSFVLIARTGVAVRASLASALEVTLRARDGIAFIGELPLAGGTYSAWVMNAETLGMTTYTNYPFESMAELGGRLFGVRADGLFELTGQTDNGTAIDAVLRTGVLDLWGGAEGSLPGAWLYVLADGTILLTVTMDRYGSRITDTYEVVPRVNEGMETENLRWVELFQDTVGTHVQFEIRNVDGGDFTFKGAQVYPVALSTRGH